MSDPHAFCSIDENGVVFDEQKKPINDADVIEEFFAELKVTDQFQLQSRLHNQPVIVEAFDAPIIAEQLQLSPEGHTLRNRYGYLWTFELESLNADEWDRFHGMTTLGQPFVLAQKAQEQLFDQVDSFDDDSITYQSQIYTLNSLWPDETTLETESYWTDKYQKHQDAWDLGEPAAALRTILPKLKLPACKVLVLGGGHGHDAALFAQLGHHVTLVDISPEAINVAKSKYGHFNNLNFMEADLFDLPTDLYGQYDLVFEHTCYCAINPSLRSELVRQWRRLLNDQGYLLGVFFTMPKRSGPPFGGSEKELRQRIQKGFHTVFWQRFRQSIGPRLGRELLVYAQKKA